MKRVHVISFGCGLKQGRESGAIDLIGPLSVLNGLCVGNIWGEVYTYNQKLCYFTLRLAIESAVVIVTR